MCPLLGAPHALTSILHFFISTIYQLSEIYEFSNALKKKIFPFHLRLCIFQSSFAIAFVIVFLVFRLFSKLKMLKMLQLREIKYIADLTPHRK